MSSLPKAQDEHKIHGRRTLCWNIYGESDGMRSGVGRGRRAQRLNASTAAKHTLEKPADLVGPRIASE